MIKVRRSSVLAYVIIFVVVIVEDGYSDWKNKLGKTWWIQNIFPSS